MRKTLWRHRKLTTAKNIDFGISFFVMFTTESGKQYHYSVLKALLVPVFSQGHHAEVWCLAISPDGDYLVSF